MDEKDKDDGASLLPADPPASPATTEALPNCDDHGWLIEHYRDHRGDPIQPEWWDGLSFRTNADHAIRFSREIDAKHMLSLLVGNTFAFDCRVTEHLWMSGSGTQVAMEPADAPRRSAAQKAPDMAGTEPRPVWLCGYAHCKGHDSRKDVCVP